MNSTIKDKLTRAIMTTGLKWPDALPILLYSIRQHTKHHNRVKPPWGTDGPTYGYRGQFRGWSTYDPKYVNVTPTQSWRLLITLTLSHLVSGTPDLWCFTIPQLQADPDCCKYTENFHFPTLADKVKMSIRTDRSLTSQEKGLSEAITSSPLRYGDMMFFNNTHNTAMELVLDDAEDRNL